MCSRLEISKLDPEKVRIDYSELFPDGKYLSEMNKY
jgi:hypothetical protein